jgi:hypothetical protein
VRRSQHPLTHQSVILPCAQRLSQHFHIDRAAVSIGAQITHICAHRAMPSPASRSRQIGGSVRGLPPTSRLRSVIRVAPKGMRDTRSIHEAVPGPAHGTPELAANLVGGQLVVPTYLIAACASVLGTVVDRINMRAARHRAVDAHDSGNADDVVSVLNKRAPTRRSARRSRPAQCLFALCRDGCSAQAVCGGQHPAELTSYPHPHVSLYTDPSCTVAIPPAHPRTGSDGDWRRRCRAVSPLCARPRS